MKDLIIYGTGDIAELAHYNFQKFTSYSTVAFTVKKDFIKETTFCNRQVIPFENINDVYSPERYDMFVAVGYSKQNLIRKEIFLEAKNMGYKLATFISPYATVLNDNKIGENCFIFEDNTIQPFVSIGDNVVLWSGNHVGHHSVIQSHSFVTSHVVISGRVTIGEQTFIGVNATIRDKVSIGAKSIIGAGVLILQDTNDEALYIGQAESPSEAPSSKVTNI